MSVCDLAIVMKCVMTPVAKKRHRSRGVVNYFKLCNQATAGAFYMYLVRKERRFKREVGHAAIKGEEKRLFHIH